MTEPRAMTIRNALKSLHNAPGLILRARATLRAGAELNEQSSENKGYFG
jgi:hypothetical protein